MNDKFSHPEIASFLNRVADGEQDPFRKQQALNHAKQRLDSVLPENPTHADVTWALSQMGGGGAAGPLAKAGSTQLKVLPMIGVILGALLLIAIAWSRPFIGAFCGVVLIIVAKLGEGGGGSRLAPYLRIAGVIVFFASVALFMYEILRTGYTMY